MKLIIILFQLFLIFNINTLFRQCSFDNSEKNDPTAYDFGNWDGSGEYYPAIRYNFYNDEFIDLHIYGNIEKKEIYASNNSEKTEYYVLIFYEPITFTKGFEADRTILTVNEIQLLFADSELVKKIDLRWKGYIVDGKVYFADNNYHTPLIIIVHRINMNG